MNQSQTVAIVRDNSWLRSRLIILWQSHFPDVDQQNEVIIRFGRWAKYQFGIISFNRKTKVSTITINRMFAFGHIPETVVDHTIAHELVHYAHGFSSPLKRRHRYPHHGGVVNKELQARGLSSALLAYKMWLKDYRKSL